MYVPSYFTMVPPCHLFLVPLSFPWWGQPGHTVRLVPYLPLSLRSLHLSFPLLPLTWSLTVTSCLASLFRWLLFELSPNFLPFGASLGILSGPSLLFLFYVLSFPPPLLSAFCPPSSPSLFSRCLPKAASPNVATPYDPKRSLAAMSWAYLRWYTHALQPLSYTPPMLVVPPTLLAARGYLTPSSLGTLLYNIYPALIQGFLSLLPFSPLEALLITATHHTKKKKRKWGGGQPGHTVRLVLRSSFFSSPPLYCSTPPHGLLSFTFLYLPTSPYLLFRTLCPGLSTGTSSLLFWLLYTLSLFKILLMRSSCFTFSVL